MNTRLILAKRKSKMWIKFRQIFVKVNGVKLLNQWLKGGVLFYAITRILVIGFSKKRLEIFRLLLQNKILVKLKKRYKYVVDIHNNKDYNLLQCRNSDKIWFCWLQGMEEAPLLVKKCYQSLHQFLKNREIILLTSENFKDYVEFPGFILKKWESGIISNTHFSDLLRIEVLIKNGGTWIDSTVLCTGNDIPDYIFDSDLFFYQILKPGRDGHSINLSSWLMTSCTNNKVLILTKEILYEYWNNNNYLIDYFLLHMCLEIALENFLESSNKVFKFSNSIPHILLLDFFEDYDEMKFGAIKQMSAFHKLSNKLNTEDMKKEGTYYDVIINQTDIL